MDLKLTGKIIKYEAGSDGDLLSRGPHLILELTGKDSNGANISGEVKLNVSARVLRDLKISDFLQIRINHNME